MSCLSGNSLPKTLTRKPCQNDGLTRNSCQVPVRICSGRMATKAQHSRLYQALPSFLRELRDEAGLTQRDLGEKLSKPQSWVYNCECANRRVDVTEFIAWAIACGIDAPTAFARFLLAADPPPPSPQSARRSKRPRDGA